MSIFIGKHLYNTITFSIFAFSISLCCRLIASKWSVDGSNCTVKWIFEGGEGGRCPPDGCWWGQKGGLGTETMAAVPSCPHPETTKLSLPPCVSGASWVAIPPPEPRRPSYGGTQASLRKRFMWQETETSRQQPTQLTKDMSEPPWKRTLQPHSDLQVAVAPVEILTVTTWDLKPEPLN